MLLIWFAKIFVLAIVLDVVYQAIVFRRFYPVEALIVANVLAVLPYLLLRGSVNRLMHRRKLLYLETAYADCYKYFQFTDPKGEAFFI